MWTCTEYTYDVIGLTGIRKKNIVFWSVDINRKVHEVWVPRGFIPVVNKIGKA